MDLDLEPQIISNNEKLIGRVLTSSLKLFYQVNAVSLNITDNDQNSFKTTKNLIHPISTFKHVPKLSLRKKNIEKKEF
jgi:hypothetical protein